MQFNIANLQTEINRKIDPIAYPVLKKRIEDQVKMAKKEMLDEFNNHGVTQEIEKGATLDHSNYLPIGNLYSFFGFDRLQQDPVERVRHMLDAGTEIIHIDKQKNKGQNYTITASVAVPTLEDINVENPLPWINKGWPSAIENGLLGLNWYIFKLFSGSRSGKGFEAKNRAGASKGKLTYVRSSNWNGIGPNYLSLILRNFKATIRDQNKPKSKLPNKFFSD